MAIDPLTFHGRSVQKSNMNFAHDGRIVDCPVKEKDPGTVYERAINNVYGDFVQDIRIPIVGRSLPFAYLKYRFLRERFTNNARRIKRVPIGTVLSEKEQENTVRFTREIGLDFGELDALRDQDNGLLYIVDANKTPGGPPFSMPAISRIRAVKALAQAFQNEFLKDFNATRH